MSDGGAWRVGSHRFVGARRPGCAGVLYCSADGHGDFRHAAGVRVSRPARSGGAQAADLSSNDGAADCRGGALALRYRQSKCAGGSAVFVRFSVGADELRPVVHTEDSSRYAMGLARSSLSCNNCVIRLGKPPRGTPSQVGCRLTLVNRSYFFIWLCSSFTTRSQALFLPVSRPPQTWESLHRLSPVLGSITVKMQVRTGACQPESTTGSSRT
jgi:hypothetical protein